MDDGHDRRPEATFRRIERLANQCTAIDVAMHEGRSQGLDWLLDHADSTVTYRSRYLVAPEWLPVLDLLVRDELVPRSLAFYTLLGFTVEGDDAGEKGELARRMGIMYVIWDDTMYASYDGFVAKRYLSSGCRTRRTCSPTLRHRVGTNSRP